MNESDLLERIRERSAHLHGRGAIVIGPGDDTAVLALPGLTLATVDHLVEDRHYDATASIDDIARKAVARSVSDIAAMAGRPVCALATGCLREGFTRGDELFERLSSWAERFEAPLAGGDIAISPGPTVLTVTILGRPHEVRGPVERSTAREGDRVCVTGALGGSLKSGRHLRFSPRIDEASELAGGLGRALTAMIDLSDGLGRDAARVARASAVRVEIDARRIPRHAGVNDWREAASDGEDYELLFCVAEGAAVPSSVGAGTPVTVIGRVVRGAGCVIIEEGGAAHDASALGWEHRA